MSKKTLELLQAEKNIKDALLEHLEYAKIIKNEINYLNKNEPNSTDYIDALKESLEVFNNSIDYLEGLLYNK